MELDSAIANEVTLPTILSNDPIELGKSALCDVVEITYRLAKIVEFKSELIFEEFTV